MSVQADIVSPLKSLLGSAQTVLILLPQNAGAEHVAAGLGLYHVLSAQGKNLTIASPTKLSQTSQALPGGDLVTNKLGNRNLVISLKVASRESVDKVSYNLDEEAKVFNLIIQPKKGSLPLNEKDVTYAYSGAQADLLFVIGANRLEDLGVFYQEERNLFTESKIVSINRFNGVTFADFHVNDQNVSGNSELTLNLIQALELSLNPSAANSLLAGIDTATNRLQNPTLKAETFDAFATLIRAGGTRQAVLPPTPPVASQNPAPAPAAPVSQVPQEWLEPKILKATP